jgi:predicted Zn-dependent peptidase
MFGGSKNIPVYDAPLQKAGGENNAFTSNDITNYYLTVPAQNIETAFWLESDRMLELNFSDQVLDVQRKVVIEEFNQRYLNQPYGDISLLLRPLCYQVHPYRWSTIGKEISHIAEAQMSDVKDFYFTHYNPQNAILSVAGNMNENELINLVEKWFGSIIKPHRYLRSIEKEPEQTEARRLEVQRNVPLSCIVISFPMCNRFHPDYYTWDLLSDLLSNGNSARLPQSLVKDKKMFTEIDAYISGSLDEGQLIIRGNILPGVSVEQAEAAIWDELNKLKTESVTETEMTRLINQAETMNVFRNIGVLNKAMNLAFYELLGDAEMLNEEISHYRMVKQENLKSLAEEKLQYEKSSTLIYLTDRN